MRMERFELPVVLNECQCRRDKFVGGLNVFHQHGSLTVDERHGVVRLMVFRHVRRWHEDSGFA